MSNYPQNLIDFIASMSNEAVEGVGVKMVLDWANKTGANKHELERHLEVVESMSRAINLALGLWVLAPYKLTTEEANVIRRVAIHDYSLAKMLLREISRERKV